MKLVGVEIIEQAQKRHADAANTPVGVEGRSFVKNGGLEILPGYPRPLS